jgi:hypothetical protein
VALDGDIAVIGMPGVGSPAGGGAARLYEHNGTSWGLANSSWKASDATAGAAFGTAVGVSGDRVVVGAPVGGQPGFPTAGAAYAYRLTQGTFTDLGFGLAGTFGLTPSLSGSGELCGGDPVTFSLFGAKTFSTANLVIGFTQINAAFKGGTLVPDANILILGLPTGIAGNVVLNGTWPNGLPPIPVYFQYWIVDAAGPQGFSASNALSVTGAP